MKNSDIYFRVDEYIILMLEKGITNIYVNGELFNQCKYLLLDIDKNKISEFDEINSIDEAVEVYKNLYGEPRNMIDPLTEFKGHCSNIQAWVENDYDTRILHSNLSFPLLRHLANVGVEKAKKVLKDEIAIRVEEGNENNVMYLLKNDYFSYFTKEELEVIFEKIKFNDIKMSFLLMQKFYKLGIKKTLDIMKDMIIKNTKDAYPITYELLKNFNLEQLNELFDNVSEEDQDLLSKINKIRNEKWLLSKEKKVKHEKTQILDYRYENK